MVICNIQCNVSSRKVCGVLHKVHFQNTLSYTAYDLVKAHSLCCKRNDDTGIFLVFLLVGS